MGADYAQHFGLAARAFEPAPDPRFHFTSLTQRKAMSAVSYALNRGTGVAVLTGAAGLGKSALLAQLAEQISGQPVTLARLAGGPGAFTVRVAEAFGLTPPGDESHALPAIEAFLIEEMRRGQRALLLLDDAGELPDDAAAGLASLAALRHGERSLLQIVLTGDEGFSARLAEDAWSGLRSQTVASNSFEPLQRNEVEPYLRHRLMRVGWDFVPALDPALAPLLHEATGGVPAAINRAMSILLDDAAEAGSGIIEGDALAAWLDAERDEAEYEVVEPDPIPDTDSRGEPALAEAQIAAIENAFAEHDRALGKLRREVAALRDRPEPEPKPSSDDRLAAIEARLDQHEQALKQMLERLIAFFERERVD
jgi:type II secretory pathway predicted ATPase ExeA